MTKSQRSIFGTVLIVIIGLCAIFIVSKKSSATSWWDLTEDELYTLTDGTQSILDKLDQPLELRFFYSKEGVNKHGGDFLLQFNNHYHYVRDLLRAYERESEGKLTLTEYDPRAYSDAEEEADRLRLRRYELGNREGFYFGLAVTSESGAKETIPFFSPDQQELVEYQISEAIDLATRQKKTKLGVLSSLSITGGGMSDYMRQMMAMQGRQPDRAWLIVDHLKKFYDVVDIPKDADTIDADVDFLMVVHPKDLPEKTLYAVDQFVVQGGKALVFTDPHALYADPPQRDPQNPFGNQGQKQSSNLAELFDAWGIEMPDGEFAGDLALAQPVRANPTSPDVVRFVGLMAFTEEQDSFNESEIVTQGLEEVAVALPGVLKKKGASNDGDVEIATLIETTGKGSTWQAESYELSGPFGPDLGRLAEKFEPGVDRLAIAMRITGRLKSAFDGPPAGEDEVTNGGEAADADDPEAVEAAAGGEGAEEGAPEGETPADEAAEAEDGHVAQAAEPTTVIVVADVDMLTDPAAYEQTFFGAAPANSNASFVLNAVEFLAGSPDLIDIRSRGSFERPFTLVDEIEREADARTRDQVKRINAEIRKFESELSELNSQATEENVGLLQNEAIRKQRDLEAEIRAKKRELREVQQAKIATIESLGSWVKNINRIVVPGLVLLAGIWLGVSRVKRRRARVKGGVS